MDAFLPNERSPWFAVQVKTTHEKRVTSALEYQNRECFLPLYRARRQWSDRIKEVDLPLFPGYIFCRFPQPARASILKIPSVTRIVGIGYEPTPIDEEEITALQKVVNSGAGMAPHPFLRAGQRVRIESGPLYGLEGLILDIRRPTRLVLSVSLLQRSVAVEIDSVSVSRIYSGPGLSAHDSRLQTHNSI
jgi:transcription antitermination factor NusG